MILKKFSTPKVVPCCVQKEHVHFRRLQQPECRQLTRQHSVCCQWWAFLKHVPTQFYHTGGKCETTRQQTRLHLEPRGNGMLTRLRIVDCTAGGRTAALSHTLYLQSPPADKIKSLTEFQPTFKAMPSWAFHCGALVFGWRGLRISCGPAVWRTLSESAHD